MPGADGFPAAAREFRESRLVTAVMRASRTISASWSRSRIVRAASRLAGDLSALPPRRRLALAVSAFAAAVMVHVVLLRFVPSTFAPILNPWR
jgi:hypothetical protein